MEEAVKRSDRLSEVSSFPFRSARGEVASPLRLSVPEWFSLSGRDDNDYRSITTLSTRR